MTNEEFIKNISFEGEEWRDIKDFEGLYMVSSFGRVISLKREVRNTHCSYRVVEQHILTPNKNTSRPKYIRHSYHQQLTTIVVIQLSGKTISATIISITTKTISETTSAP